MSCYCSTNTITNNPLPVQLWWSALSVKVMNLLCRITTLIWGCSHLLHNQTKFSPLGNILSDDLWFICSGVFLDRVFNLFESIVEMLPNPSNRDLQGTDYETLAAQCAAVVSDFMMNHLKKKLRSRRVGKKSGVREWLASVDISWMFTSKW